MMSLRNPERRDQVLGGLSAYFAVAAIFGVMGLLSGTGLVWRTAAFAALSVACLLPVKRKGLVLLTIVVGVALLGLKGLVLGRGR